MLVLEGWMNCNEKKHVQEVFDFMTHDHGPLNCEEHMLPKSLRRLELLLVCTQEMDEMLKKMVTIGFLTLKFTNVKFTCYKRTFNSCNQHT